MTSHTNDVLIVREFNFGHIQALAPIQLLLVLQDIVIEEFLQFFIAIVDAELFE